MSNKKNNPGDNPPDENIKGPDAETVESPDNELLEKAVEILAEQVESQSGEISKLKEQVQEMRKKVGSVDVVVSDTPVIKPLPVYEIDDEKWKCKFPSFFIGKVKTTAEDLANDEATLRNLLAEKPNLFVKL